MYQFFLYKKMSGVVTGFQKEDFGKIVRSLIFLNVF